VFRKDGRFVREIVIAKGTLGSGSVWDVGFSTDPKQAFLFINDGTNQLYTSLIDRRCRLSALSVAPDTGPGNSTARTISR
jgi:hypothetical protein